MDKWIKRDRKLKGRQASKSIRQAMNEREPRKKTRRYKSRDDMADEELRIQLSLEEGF